MCVCLCHARAIFIPETAGCGCLSPVSNYAACQCLCPCGIGFSIKLALPLILPLLLAVSVHRWLSKRKRELNTGPNFSRTLQALPLQKSICTASSSHAYTHIRSEIQVTSYCSVTGNLSVSIYLIIYLKSLFSPAFRMQLSYFSCFLSTVTLVILII